MGTSKTRVLLALENDTPPYLLAATDAELLSRDHSYSAPLVNPIPKNLFPSNNGDKLRNKPDSRFTPPIATKTQEPLTDARTFYLLTRTISSDRRPGIRVSTQFRINLSPRLGWKLVRIVLAVLRYPCNASRSVAPVFDIRCTRYMPARSRSRTQYPQIPSSYLKSTTQVISVGDPVAHQSKAPYSLVVYFVQCRNSRSPNASGSCLCCAVPFATAAGRLSNLGTSSPISINQQPNATLFSTIESLKQSQQEVSPY